MADSKSINQLTISDAVKIINDILVNAIIDLDFRVEAFISGDFVIDVKGLKIRFLYITKPDGKFSIWQYCYSEKVEIGVFKMSYDEDVIYPILKDIVDNGMWSVKASELAQLKERQLELELELA